MKLAMILGRKQGESIKPRLQNIKDNLDIDIFEDVKEFAYSVSKRNTIYDRILVLSTKITPVTLRDLHAVWGMYSKETAVIMLSRKDADEEKAKMFLDVFKTPVACAMLVTNTTVSIIAESVLHPTGELTSKYGYKNFLDVEVDEDEYIPPEPVKPPEPVQPPVQAPVQQPVQKQPQKKKKRGFLSGLFGSRGGDDEEPVQPQEQQPAEDYTDTQEPYQESEYDVPADTQDYGADQYGYDAAEEPQGYVPAADSDGAGYAEPDTDYAESEGSYSEPETQGQVDDFGDDLGSMTIDGEDDFSDGFSDDPPAEVPVAPQPPVQPQRPKQRRPQPPVAPPQPQPSRRQNLNVTPPAPSSVVDVTFDAGLEDDGFQDAGEAQRGPTADVDFGSDGILAQTPQTRTPRQPRSVEADENLGDVSVIADEAKYRQQREAPRTIIKTVREPVMGSGSALKSVYSGRMKKVLIVTGDRGTGVTSTAMSLARELAKHVEVLYFDCDTLNHGILNYIDYSVFSGYEQIHLEGVKSCKSAQVFDRCIIDWDENFSLLSSDFSCECDDEDLAQTAQVVAECSDNYGVVVVDCPMSKLHCLQDLVLVGTSVVCVEASKRGFMNMLCQLEACTLPARYKRNLASKSTMFLTKCNPKTDVKRLLAYIKSIYQPDGVDWMGLPLKQFNGKVDDNLLNIVLEG